MSLNILFVCKLLNMRSLSQRCLLVCLLFSCLDHGELQARKSLLVGLKFLSTHFASHAPAEQKLLGQASSIYQKLR